MRILQSFLKGIDNLSEWTGKIFNWTVIPLMVLVVMEVIRRKAFNSPTVWSLEITTFIYGFYFMIVAAYTLLYRGHVSVDIIYNRFSNRGKAIIDIVLYLTLFFIFIGIGFKGGVGYAASAWELRARSVTAFSPILYPIKTVIPVAVLLLLLQGLSNFIRSLMLAIKGQNL